MHAPARSLRFQILQPRALWRLRHDLSHSFPEYPPHFADRSLHRIGHDLCGEPRQGDVAARLRVPHAPHPLVS